MSSVAPFPSDPADAVDRRTAAFAAALSSALHRLDEDGALPETAVRSLRHAIDDTPAALRQAIAFEPERHLGRFEDLPEAARNAIVEAVAVSDDRGGRGYRFGPLHAALLRGLWRLKNTVYRLGSPDAVLGRALRGFADVLAYGARKAPLFSIRFVDRARSMRRVRRGSGARLRDLLTYAGLPTSSFAACYARGLPQAPESRAFWHDPERQVTVGRVLGLDFLPAEDGYWYVESNAHPGLEAERSRLYERDPMCMRMASFAAERGYRQLVVLDNTSEGIDPLMGERYAAEAELNGLRLSLPVMPNVPGRAKERGYGVPDNLPDRTLVVRIRPYPVSIDHVLDSKRACYRVLHMYLEHTSDAAVKLPVTSSEPVLGSTDPDAPFPNVVYKLPEIEQGRGVYFLKARSAGHAREMLAEALHGPRRRSLDERIQLSVTNANGIYQPFVRSKTIDGRLYKIRALIMITPVGVAFLSAHRFIAAHPLPERLDFGPVRDFVPYLLNSAMGSSRQLPPAEEERGVCAAAEAAGRGFAWAVERSYRTGP